ncbi:MAG: AraC family transcriptional regulator [Leptospirales bacterium]|nr:AraC family transcriptional regulator [Leptospirales bacterium]
MSEPGITQKAIWFVESHFRSSPDLAEIADACDTTPFHLTRTFATTTGVTLARYVRARRLSEAARSLAAGSEDILSLALETGYGSHEAFTRAFKQQFGKTPEEVRAARSLAQVKTMEPMNMHQTRTIKLKTPRFEKPGQRLFAGLQRTYDCNEPNGLPDQWQEFGPFIGQIKNQKDPVAYGICHNFDEEGNFDYLTAVEISEKSDLPKGFVTLLIPAQEYVVFRHEGHVADIRSTISAAYSDWFPESGKVAAESPMLERYGPEFNPTTGKGGLEIWIAIKDKSAK